MKVSWDDDIPKIWKKHVPNQQPVIIITIILIITIIIIINIIIIKIRIGFDPSPASPDLPSATPSFARSQSPAAPGEDRPKSWPLMQFFLSNAVRRKLT